MSSIHLHMSGKIDPCCGRTVKPRQNESTLVTRTRAPTHINSHLLGIQTNTFPLAVTAFTWVPYLCHIEKWNANWQRSRLCTTDFSLEAPLKAAPTAMFTAGLVERWQQPEAGRGNASEVFTAFADCSACALRLSDYRGFRILSVLTPHASSMMQLHSHSVCELKEKLPQLLRRSEVKCSPVQLWVDVPERHFI